MKPTQQDDTAKPASEADMAVYRGIAANYHKDRSALAQQDAQAVPLTEKQRVYFAQAWAMLEDYAADQRQAGNDSIADGADASAHEIKLMLSAAPTPPVQQDDIRSAEDELNCAEEVLDGYAAHLDLEETAFDCIGEYITAVCDALKAAPTPPAQQPEVRQWAGLTDVGIATAMISAGDPPEQSSEGFIQWCEKFADAIEANLKERNA